MSGTLPLLSLDAIGVTYNRAIVALHDVSLAVRQGEIVVLLGANGAGKSTTLKAVSNLLPAQRGAVTQGRVMFDGRDITHLSSNRSVRAGLVQVLEGRHCFASLTIEENLVSGAAAIRAPRLQTRQDLERVMELFPTLRDKRRLQAGLASGGQQQMTAIGRALMSRPRLLVLDEPSMGLAPKVVEEIFVAISRLNRDEGLSVLMAEQNSSVALRFAHRAYVIEHGVVVADDDAETLRRRDDLKGFYLGSSGSRARTDLAVALS